MRYRYNGKNNAWKKYGVLVVSGLLSAGTAAASNLPMLSIIANAEESEAEQRITLKVADSAKEEEDSEAVLTLDTEEPEKEVTLKVAEEQTEQAEEVTEQGDENRVKLAVAGEAEEQEEKTEETEEPKEAENTDQKAQEAEKEEKPLAGIDYVAVDGASIAATDVSGVLESMAPAMVVVNSTAIEQQQDDLYEQEQEVNHSATGMIIGENGDEIMILTSSDAIESATELTITFSADEYMDKIPAKVKGSDRNCGISVLAINIEDVPKELLDQIKIAKLDSSESAKAGQAAIIVGNQMDFGIGVSCGVISAVQVYPNSTSNVPYMLIDANINTGTSGAAVLNANGEIIGVCIGKLTDEISSGMGIAVASDDVKDVVERLCNKETRDKLTNNARGYIGASVVNVNDDAKALYDMPEGAFVYEVTSGSAADEAGIRKGDIITKFEGEDVTSSDDLIDKISYFGAGETVTLEIATANEGTYTRKEVEVTLQPGAATEEDDLQQENDAQEDGKDSSDDKDQKPEPDREYRDDRSNGQGENPENNDNNNDGSVNPYEEFFKAFPGFWGDGENGPFGFGGDFY